MWSPLLAPGRLVLLNGERALMRRFQQELAHHVVHTREGAILWCDGEHGFNPYDFAELNLERGREADDGADRVLIKRCMTPFQWDTVLTKHLDQKLLETPASMVLAAPYDALFSTDELKDWEQEDYVRFSLAYLKNLAKRHEIPILLCVDMNRWWRTHPALARQTFEAVEARWSISWSLRGWKAVQDKTAQEIAQRAPLQATIEDFAPTLMPLPPRPVR